MKGCASRLALKERPKPIRAWPFERRQKFWITLFHREIGCCSKTLAIKIKYITLCKGLGLESGSSVVLKSIKYAIVMSVVSLLCCWDQCRRSDWAERRKGRSQWKIKLAGKTRGTYVVIKPFSFQALLRRAPDVSSRSQEFLFSRSISKLSPSLYYLRAWLRLVVMEISGIRTSTTFEFQRSVVRDPSLKERDWHNTW